MAWLRNEERTANNLPIRQSGGMSRGVIVGHLDVNEGSPECLGNFQPERIRAPAPINVGHVNCGVPPQPARSVQRLRNA
jgi:hypothetical protein